LTGNIFLYCKFQHDSSGFLVWTPPVGAFWLFSVSENGLFTLNYRCWKFCGRTEWLAAQLCSVDVDRLFPINGWKINRFE